MTTCHECIQRDKIDQNLKDHKEFKDDLLKLHEAKHSIYERLQVFELSFTERLSALEKQIIPFNLIPQKLDEMMAKFNEFLQNYGKETEKLKNNTTEILALKENMVTKKDLMIIIKDGKYQKLWGGLIGAIITFIILGIIGFTTDFTS